jgi:hypothetical protein
MTVSRPRATVRRRPRRVATRALGTAPRRKATTPTTRSAAASPRRIPNVKTAKDELPVSTILPAAALRRSTPSITGHCRWRVATMRRNVSHIGNDAEDQGVPPAKGLHASAALRVRCEVLARRPQRRVGMGQIESLCFPGPCQRIACAEDHLAVWGRPAAVIARRQWGGRRGRSCRVWRRCGLS